MNNLYLSNLLEGHELIFPPKQNIIENQRLMQHLVF